MEDKIASDILDRDLEVEDIQMFFDEYSLTKTQHDSAADKAKAILKPMQDALKEQKELLNETPKFWKEAADKAKAVLEKAARLAHSSGIFGENKARLQLDGGYVEVRKPVESVEIVDLAALLKSAVGQGLIESVTLKKGALETIKTLGGVDGVNIVISQGGFVASVKKEN